MRIAMLGAGNVATHLSKALIRSGNSVVQVWSRNNENAIELALQIGANSIADFESIDEDLDLVIIAVSDDAISYVADSIPNKENRVIIHTSGSTDISVLKKHPNSAVLYPLQTFSKDVDLDFTNVPLFVEGNNEDSLTKVLSLAKQLSKKVTAINSADRVALHIAAVFACNFTNHLFSVSQDILEKSSISFELIKPLIFETVNKIAENKPTDVQTGPAKRNDLGIMTKHLEILRNNPEWHKIYGLISQNIVKKYANPKSSLK